MNDIKNLKKIELEMLDEIVNACKQLEINYYVIGGTLLGAVRHKGFIPWDDDIDIGMLRSDYNIFINKAQQILPKHLFVQTHKSDPQCPICFCKVRNNETTFVESMVSQLNINHGVFIDIFPLDYYPEKKLQENITEARLNLILTRVSPKFMVRNAEVKSKSMKTKFKRWIVNRLYPTVDIAIDTMEKQLNKMKKTSLLRNYFGAWGKKEIIPASYFMNSVMLEFEGRLVNAPAEYEAYLRKIYGNYMQLPPVEKRITHHETDIIDLEKSYKLYI